jgi:hypothetical protein
MSKRRSPLQLDFLDVLDQSPKPASVVVPFPADRMIGDHRLAAAAMISLPPKQRRGRINFQSDLLWLHFIRAGIERSEVERQKEIYHAALTAEVDRQRVKAYLFGDLDEIGGAG